MVQTHLFNSSTKPTATDSQEKNLYEQLGRQSMEIDYLKQFALRYQSLSDYLILTRGYSA